MAGTLQLYWQAPNCTDEYLPNVINLWFTIAQRRTVVYNPSKSTAVLTYMRHEIEPLTTTQHLSTTTTTVPRTNTMSTTKRNTVAHTRNTVTHTDLSDLTEPEGRYPSNFCVVASTMTAVACSLLFSLSCGIIGGFCGRWITLSRQRKQPTNDSPLPTEVTCANIPDRAARSTPNEAMEPTVNCNEAYGHMITLSQQRKQPTYDSPLPTEVIYANIPDRAARSTPNKAMEPTVNCNEAYGHITSV